MLMSQTLTITPLYPNAFYMAGFMVYKPICFQSAIALLCSLVVFPQSVSSQFRSRFSTVLDPLGKAMGQIEELFSDASSMATFGSPGHDGTGHHVNSDGTFSFDEPIDRETKVDTWGDRSDEIRITLLGSLKGMAPLQAQQRYLDVDITYGRLCGQDLKEIFNVLASVQVRASGLSFFFNALVRKIRRTHMDSAGFSVRHTVSMMSLHNEANRLSRHSTRTSRPVSRQTSTSDVMDLAAHHRQSVDAAGRQSATPGTPATPATSDDEGSDHPERHERPGRKRLGHGHRSHEHIHDRGISEGRLARRLLHLSRDHSKDRSSSRERGRSKEHPKHGRTNSHVSLLEKLHKSQQPVGVYESQRYMDLERGDER